MSVARQDPVAVTTDRSTPFRLRRLDLAAVAAGDPDARRDHDAIVRRGAVPDPAVRAAARATLAEVRARGDAAVRVANEAVGGGRRDGRLILDPDDLRGALERLEPRVRRALDQAIDHVRRFAETQRPASTRTTIAPGIEIERRWTPLASVGAYVPGGSAPYPSSLVMTVVPARVAGVGRIVVASPADRDGETNAVLLAAAGLLEVDAFVVAGGAQAIGALAYGLPDAGLAPVDRIVGPGNAWVTAAKIEVCGEVGIDLPAGPSEGMVLAAPPAAPDRVAADLITQAEHGPDSPAILVTTDAAFADVVEAAVARRLASATRRDILAAALRDHGRIALAPTLDAAIDFVNAYAPEHLSVDVEPLEPTVARLRNAGSLFVGPWAPESAGDYATGANHVLPTGGLARASSGLSVEAYGKFSPGPADRSGRPGLHPCDHRDPGRDGGLARSPRRRRDPLRGPDPMSPTPVTFTLAERAVDLQLGSDRRRGRRAVRPRPRDDRPVRPQYLAHPTGAHGPAPRGRPVRGPLSEYPPTDYRRLVDAAAARYGVSRAEILVGAGADEILDIVAKVCIPAGGTAVVPTPTYAMYRVLTEQRGATVIAVPRLGEAAGWALDGAAVRAAAADHDAAVVWLCSPNNPTALPEPDGAIAALLADLAADAAAAGRPAPIVVLDEAYAEFVGSSLLGLRETYPNLVVVRTASKAYALAGLRVGFAVARPELIARLNPFRPPGSVSTVSVTLVTEALLDPAILDANLDRVARERRRLTDALRAVGWSVGPSVTNFILVAFGSVDRARRRRAGAPVARPRAAHVRGRPPAGRSPATDRPRPRRERPAHRRRDRAREPCAHRTRRRRRHADRPMTTPLGSIEIGPREGRRVTIARTTAETEITVTLGLDGAGHTGIDTGIGFYDHLLGSLAHHGLFDLAIQADGDLQVDEHHTVEDVALVLGAAFSEALGDRAGIARFGSELGADGRIARHGGDRHRRPPVRRHRPAVPRPARGRAPAPAGRARARVVRPDRGRHAPRQRHRSQRPSPCRGRVQGTRSCAAGRLRDRSTARRRRLDQGRPGVTG